MTMCAHKPRGPHDREQSGLLSFDGFQPNEAGWAGGVGMVPAGKAATCMAKSGAWLMTGGVHG